MTDRNKKQIRFLVQQQADKEPGHNVKYNTGNSY